MTKLYLCNNCNWKYTTNIIKENNKNMRHICDICQLPYYVVCQNWLK